MKTKISTTITKCFLISIISFLFFSRLYAQDTSSHYVTGEVIVQLNSNVTPSQLTQAFTNIGLSQEREISDILNIWLFQYNSGSIQADSCLNLLRQNYLVKIAQFNHYVYFNATPNDPGFSNQWGMNKIDAPDAWNITTGGTTVQNDQIVIAVLDAGFDINHQDLNFIDKWNAMNNNNIVTSDPLGHGTLVSGVAGAIGNNGIGVAGVNWNAKIMPIQVLNENVKPTEANVVAGYSYVLNKRQLYNQTNGAQGDFIVVTNASFSTESGSPSDYPIWCGIYDALGAEGILNVCAVWNKKGELGVDFTEVPGMCSSQYLIAVTNTDQNDNLASDAPWSKTYIELAAPGTQIYSTLPGNNYGYDSGTSFAAPHVAGAIALMYAAACDPLITDYKANPSQIALTMKQFLLNGSDPIYSLLLKIGYGRLNVYKSIIKMSEQYDYDLNVTGTETSSKEYDAIHDITVENYTGTGNLNVNFRAGNSIDFKPGTIISPSTGGYFHAFIDKNAFDCAIPIQPLSVGITGPTLVWCTGDIPYTYNAVTTGGITPYSYTWFIKPVTSSSWTTINYNNPNFTLIPTEAFYIQVQVTDNRGTTALSPIVAVNCYSNGKIAPPDTSVRHADTIFNLTNSSKQSTSIQISIESNNLRQSFNAFPNPSTGNVTITFTLAKAGSVTIQIYDNIGGKVVDVITNKPYEIGKHSIVFNGKDLAAGVYFYTISTDEGINALKLVISK